MRVLAIGATGFIGRHVVRQLTAEGHQVAVVHRGQTPLPVYRGVTEILAEHSRAGERRPEFRAWSPDVAIDMILGSAAQARTTADALRGIVRRLVVLSSADVYRAMAVLHRIEAGPLEPVPLNEESPLRTLKQTYSPEALERVRAVFPWVDASYDKVQVERTIGAEQELPVTILRLPMVYGPGDPLHRLFPALKRMEDGRRAILLERTMAAWVPCRGYVENVAHAIALATTSDAARGRIYNVSDSALCDEAEWTEKIGSAAGGHGRVVCLPPERTPRHLLLPYNFEQHLRMDSTRIRAELGYTEPVSVGEALGRTVEWERANPPRQIDPAQYDYAAEDQAIAAVP